MKKFFEKFFFLVSTIFIFVAGLLFCGGGIVVALKILTYTNEFAITLLGMCGSVLLIAFGLLLISFPLYFIIKNNIFSFDIENIKFNFSFGKKLFKKQKKVIKTKRKKPKLVKIIKRKKQKKPTITIPIVATEPKIEEPPQPVKPAVSN